MASGLKHHFVMVMTQKTSFWSEFIVFWHRVNKSVPLAVASKFVELPKC